MFSARAGGAMIVGAALLLTACGGGSDEPTGDTNAPVTLTWWHNATQDPLKGYWQAAADAYTAEHPNVTFKIEPIQNEQVDTKVALALQSNDPPDIFPQWGGGDLASQVESGKLLDITEGTKTVADGLGGTADGWQVDGKQYGLPYSVGVVGFWYRPDLFKQAGIDSVPVTMDDLYAAIDKLKAAKVAPISVGSKDKWPDAFYWGYFAVRNCTADVLKQSTKDKAFTDPCFIKAGEDLQKLLDAEPFQKGFLGTPAQQGAASSAGLLANGKAAMELMGHWQSGVVGGLTPDKKPLSEDKLSWFPFPTVDGGAGAPDAAFGGGDGFSCSYKAPPACVDFLNFILSVDQQKKFGALGVGPPIVAGSEDSVSDVNLKTTMDFRAKSSFVQLYFDKALPTAVGEALNDQVANMFAGKATPEQITQAVADAAANE